MEQSPYELIIEIDVMIRFPSVSFNWKKRIFTCGTNNIPMSGLRHLTKEMQGRVQMSNTTVIPPRSVMRVDAKVSGLYTDRANLMFSPKELLEQRGISIVNMLLDATCGLISIPITNVSFESVTLHTGTTLGMLAADICLVENVPTDTDKAFVVKRKSKVEESEKTFLNENEQKALNNLLTKYVHLFAQNDTDVGRTHLIEHKIDTGDAKPISQPMYRVPFSQRQVITEHIDKMLANNIIRPSNSPWASPIVLVLKKDGTLRFCVDYHKLNAVTKKDSYPLPRIDDILDSLGNAKYFLSLDQCWGYWQIPVSEMGREKTAFLTYNGLYEYLVLPFGLNNAPSNFQRLMDIVLHGLQWKLVLYTWMIFSYIRIHSKNI